jgi:hypothetical protein
VKAVSYQPSAVSRISQIPPKRNLRNPLMADGRRLMAKS